MNIVQFFDFFHNICKKTFKEIDYIRLEQMKDSNTMCMIEIDIHFHRNS